MFRLGGLGGSNDPCLPGLGFAEIAVREVSTSPTRASRTVEQTLPETNSSSDDDTTNRLLNFTACRIGQSKFPTEQWWFPGGQAPSRKLALAMAGKSTEYGVLSVRGAGYSRGVREEGGGGAEISLSLICFPRREDGWLGVGWGLGSHVQAVNHTLQRG